MLSRVTRDETRGLCQKRHYDGFRGTSCILYVHKHRAISPRDDECGRAPYDERECAQVGMHTDEGVHEAHDTMGFH